MSVNADIAVDQLPLSNQIDNATTILGSIWDPIAQNYTTSNLSVVDIGAFMIGYSNLVVAVNGANAGEIPLLDANGQLVSSGVKIDDSVTLTQNLWTAAKTQAAITQQFLNTPSLPPASVASTANVASLSGLSTIDGYALLSNDIILLKNQTSLDNGFWRVSSGAWVRQYFDGSSFADVTTQFNYAALGTNGGVVNVLNGTVNRNLQFQLAVSNPTAPFGATTVFVTALTKLPVASPVNLFVDSSIGNDSNFTGAQSFPFASLSKAYSSISTTPCTLNLSGNTAYSSAVSWGKVNVTIQGNNLSSNGGTQTISAQQTLPAASRYIHFTNITFNTGATAPFAFASGALCSNEFKNITVNSFAADWLGLNAGCQNFIRLNNIAFTTPGINAINLPAFTNPFAIYVDRQDTFCGMLLFTGTGSVNTTIYVNAGIPEANVRIPSSFLGTVIWLSPAFAFRLGSVSSPNGLITNQTSLTAILSHTATTGYDGFYVISGFNPTQFSRGAIIGKQTVAGVGTLVWLARSFGYAGPMLTDASGQYLVPVISTFDWSAVAFGGGSSSMPNFTLATRPTTPNVPYVNSTLQIAEYYDGTNYRPLEDVVTVRAMLTAAPSGGNTSGAGMYVDTSASPPSILYWNGTTATTAYPFASAPRLINDSLNTYSRGSTAWTQLGSASVPSFTLAARPTTTGLIYANTTLGVTEYFDGSAYHPLEEVITVNGVLGAAPTGANASGLYVDTSASPPSIIYWDGSTVTVAYGFATAPRLISDGTDIWSRGLYAWAKMGAGASAPLPIYAFASRPTTAYEVYVNSTFGVVEFYDGSDYRTMAGTLEVEDVLTAAPVTGTTPAGLYVGHTAPFNIVYWNGSASFLAYAFAVAPEIVRTAAGDLYSRGASTWGVVGAGGAAAVAQYAKYSCPDQTVQTLSAYYPVKFTRQDLNLGTAVTVNAAGDQITFQPGYTYRVRGSHGLGVGAGSYVQSRWYDAFAGNFVGNRAGVASPISSNLLGYNPALAEYTFTPTAVTILQLRIDYYDNTTVIGYDAGVGTDQQPWFEAEAIAAPYVVPAAKATAPTITVLKSGSGTYTPPAGTSYLKVRAIAGGGGGAGGGAQSGYDPTTGNGTVGGDTLFGALTLKGGSKNYVPTSTTITLPTGFAGYGIAGAGGVFGGRASATNPANGGTGAPTPFGNGGSGGTSDYGAQSPSANTGAGGGGGGTFANGAANAGTGGGSGDFAEFTIAAPATSYSYTVGAPGAGGAALGSGNPGFSGGSGVIIIEEYY